jgi:hypothetical protein
MIKYALNCSNGHRFESWFASAAGFDDQAAQDLVVCPACRSHDVSKAIMAPALLTGAQKKPAKPFGADRGADAGRDQASHHAQDHSDLSHGDLRPADLGLTESDYADPDRGSSGQGDSGRGDSGRDKSGPLAEAAQARQMVRELHRYVRETSENVGENFAEEARKIADGDAPKRAIHGAASIEEARALLSEGLPVLPLPPLPDELN